MQQSTRFTQKRKPQENDEFLWLMSLSDLMILLFIFFVVMFSFSFNKMKDSDFKKILASFKKEDQPIDAVDKIQSNLNNWIQDQNLKDQISIQKNKDGSLEVQIKDQLLFHSGEFELKEKSAELMAMMALTLNKIPAPYQVGIEGHTDDIPIHSAKIQSNWELSAKRSLSFLTTLNLEPAMQKRTVLMAYGETRPLVPNRDPAGKPIPENQSKNRRVTIRIF